MRSQSMSRVGRQDEAWRAACLRLAGRRGKLAKLALLLTQTFFHKQKHEHTNTQTQTDWQVGRGKLAKLALLLTQIQTIQPFFCLPVKGCNT